MDNKKIDQMIEILQAVRDGKELEYNTGLGWIPYNGTWQLISYLDELDRDVIKMRVKPEPEYRPYKDVEEFLQASKEHGPLIKPNATTWVSILAIHRESGRVVFNIDPFNTTIEGVSKYEWQDGTPCGIKE